MITVFLASLEAFTNFKPEVLYILGFVLDIMIISGIFNVMVK